MHPLSSSHRSQHPRFSIAIIRHAVGLSFRFCLRFREVEEGLLEWGIVVTYKAMRKGCRKCGQQSAHQLRCRRPRPRPAIRLERTQLPLRTRIDRLERNRMGFSQSRQMHELISGLLLHRVEFGLQIEY